MQLTVDQDILRETNTDLVTLCVGTHTFYASRRLLCYHSNYIETQLDGESAMFFIEFSDIPDIFELCLVMINGKEVEMTVQRFQGFLKFSVLYKVDAMYNELLEWISKAYEQNGIEFMKIHSFARLEISYDPNKKKLLELCKDLLKSDGLYIIERELDLLPENSVDNNFLELLVDPDCIWSTLPLLQKLLINGAKAAFILPLFNNSTILSALRTNRAFTCNFMTHLRSMLVESNQKELLMFIKIQEKLMNLIPSSQYKIMPLLSCEDFFGTAAKRSAFLAMSPDKVLKLKQRFTLRDVVYCELILHWLTARVNEPTKKVPFIQKAWEFTNFTRLSRGFIYDLKANFEKLAASERLVLELPTSDHLYRGCGFYLTEHETYALRIGHPVPLQHHCNVDGCDKQEVSKHGVCLQLTDDTPCYTTNVAVIKRECHQHKVPVHWWFSMDGTEIISLITNSMKEIGEILATTQRIYVCCMIQMVANPAMDDVEIL